MRVGALSLSGQSDDTVLPLVDDDVDADAKIIAIIYYVLMYVCVFVCSELSIVSLGLHCLRVCAQTCTFVCNHYPRTRLKTAFHNCKNFKNIIEQ